jgi:endogenous inhibitor of DNA gyrase (YacG/DUF329 family)
MTKTRSLRCPICRKIVLRSEPEFPFCSERCRTIDLGKWASGDYVISTPINDPEELMNAESAEARRRQALESNDELPQNPHGQKIH